MSENLNNFVEIYTDGACRGNPGPGGWGALLRFGDTEKELSGSVPETTNNRMELMAAIESLRALENPANVRLYTDSQYVQKGISEWIVAWRRRGWKTKDGKPVANADLWYELDCLASQHHIEWIWVRGHNNHPDNERADRLARNAARRASNYTS